MADFELFTVTTMESLVADLMLREPDDLRRNLQYAISYNQDELLLNLARLANSCRRPQNTASTLKLLHMLLTEHDLIGKIHTSTLTKLKEPILVCFKTQTAGAVSEFLAGIVRNLALRIFDATGGAWTEILFLVLKRLGTGASLQESALRVVHDFPEQLVHQFKKFDLPFFRSAVLRKSQSLAMDSEFQSMALGSYAVLVEAVEDKELHHFLSTMLGTMTELLRRSRNDVVQKRLNVLLRMAKTEVNRTSKFFKDSHLHYVYTWMVEIAEPDDVDDTIRRLVLSVLMNLDTMETAKMNGVLCRLTSTTKRKFVSRLVKIVVSEDTPMSKIGLHFLKTLVEEVVAVVKAHLKSDDMENRRTGIRVIAAIAKPGFEGNITFAGELLLLLLSLSRDPEAEVRCVLIKTVRAFGSNLWVKRFHGRILSELAVWLEDENQQIQVQAAKGVREFTQNCSADILAPLLPKMVSNLVVLLKIGSNKQKATALSALSSVARSSKGCFTAYYKISIDSLKSILLTETGPCISLIQAKCLKCITKIGLAVGKERSSKDALEVMEVLTGNEMMLKMDSKIRVVVLQAVLNLCLLGEGSSVPVQFVMPMVRDIASQNTSGVADGQKLAIGGEKILALDILACLTKAGEGKGDSAHEVKGNG